MSSHTPGPWHLDDTVVAGAYEDICITQPIGKWAPVDDLGEARANARLIAASPDLLQAAQALSGHVLEDHGNQLNYDSCAVCSVLINDLDRAIEKATGEMLTWGPSHA